nr:hypothetical protein [Tanacetum cinerariifolium]
MIYRLSWQILFQITLWIEEDLEEDPKTEEDEEEGMEIEDEMNDPEIINPYEIEKGGIGMKRRIETREHYELKESVSTLEDQMRGLMLKDKEEKERSMPSKAMSQAAIERLITQRVNAALEAKRDSQANAGGNKAMQMEQEAKIGHLQFANGRALTWWNSQVTTLGLEVANGKSWGDMKKMMMEKFCPDEEFQLTKKVEAYFKGLPENIKGEVTSSHPVNLNVTVCMAYTLMEQKIQAKAERIAKGNKRKWENSQIGNRNNNNNNNNNNRGNYQDNTRHHQYNNQRQGNARA